MAEGRPVKTHRAFKKDSIVFVRRFLEVCLVATPEGLKTAHKDDYRLETVDKQVIVRKPKEFESEYVMVFDGVARRKDQEIKVHFLETVAVVRERDGRLVDGKVGDAVIKFQDGVRLLPREKFNRLYNVIEE